MVNISIYLKEAIAQYIFRELKNYGGEGDVAKIADRREIEGEGYGGVGVCSFPNHHNGAIA
ncbi:hypothetical protein [Coleofasciculus sp.]|uniref:hypothetical protein n=1 Tax=Coleofasciculus sp. TaxID=3100458 RepID=UPI0039F9A46B